MALLCAALAKTHGPAYPLRAAGYIKERTGGHRDDLPGDARHEIDPFRLVETPGDGSQRL